jgi:hypothetical protein
LVQNDAVGYKNQLQEAVDSFDFCLNTVRDNPDDSYLKERLAANCTCTKTDAENARNR